MEDSEAEEDATQLLGGRYRLGELLGVGGSASVFEAEDLDQLAETSAGATLVAIKVLHPHLSGDAAAREAFFREAQAAQALRHPNVVAVHDFGLHEAGGVTMAWIALDLVHGPTVAEWVEATGPLPPAEAVAVLDGVLAALEAAHAIGLVHRDVSPQNVMLDGAGNRLTGERLQSSRVRLLDFGIAAATGLAALGHDILLTEHGEPSGAVPGGDSGARPASVVGNANFMSPEQAQGKPVRAAGDLYQAGALLYFLLTARPPYPRSSAALVLEAQVSAPPPVPSALVPAARPLDRVVTRAMTKTPARRYRDAAEFRAALAEALTRGAGTASRTQEVEGAAAPAAAATRILPPGRTGELEYLATEEPATEQRAAPAPGGFVAVVAGAVILGLACWAVISATASPEVVIPSLSPTVATASETPPAESPTEPPAPPPAEGIMVPTLYGTLAAAEIALRQAGLALGTVTRLESAEKADTVLSQYPTARQTVAAGSTVNITIANGTNSVPSVAGMAAGTARALLESAGFTAATIPADATGAATVTGTQPGAGAVLRLGVTVILLVAEPRQTPEPSPSGPTPQPSPSIPAAGGEVRP
ncbi:protein kinase domain-containing protein [Luethyella okanaganae]|uniref:non-specific serine/threonine protein kinase n=1 Tax=Luethyella okanaganae TaxID=69372 RepID=A0ABW1VGW0_9MICO